MEIYDWFANVLPDLSSSVGNNQENNPEDVIIMKERLFGLEKIDRPKDGFSPILDREMVEGIKQVQKENGLKVDGIARSGQETDRKTASELAKKWTMETRTGDPREPGMIESAVVDGLVGAGVGVSLYRVGKALEVLGGRGAAITGGAGAFSQSLGNSLGKNLLSTYAGYDDLMTAP